MNIRLSIYIKYKEEQIATINYIILSESQFDNLCDAGFITVKDKELILDIIPIISNDTTKVIKTTTYEPIYYYDDNGRQSRVIGVMKIQ